MKLKRALKQLKRNPNLILELGAWETKRGKGWITLGLHEECDIVHNLRKPIPFPDDTFLNIYSSHLLEHFYYPVLIFLLKEVHRVLKPGGTFSVCVPDASIYLNAYCSPESFDADFYCRFKPAVNFYSKIDYVNYMAYMTAIIK